MMNLEEHIPGLERPIKHSLSGSQLRYLLRRGSRLSVASSVPEGVEELGRINHGPGGAKLEAIQTLHVLPGWPCLSTTPSVATDPRSDKYELEPASGGRRDILLLRHGDMIASPGTDGSVLCVWQASEVQVNSSTEPLHDQISFEKGGVDETPEDETEVEAAPEDTITEVPVTQPVTQPTKSQPSATPRLPTHRSVLVHETPTTNRILDVTEHGVAASNEGPRAEPVPLGATVITETFSTARTGQSPRNIAQDSLNSESATDRKRVQLSPQVRVNDRRSKRGPSLDAPPNSDVESSAEGPPTKRTRKNGLVKGNNDDIVQASPLDNINADPLRTTYSAKGKKRFADVSETTPTKSSRSSQRSATATSAVAYEGDPPRVATSNSGIKDGSSTAKFLRKHGGALVTSVEDKCNVLCVRDGGLARTMKVIQAIALGIPIVTDKWLVESARAEGFLDLSSFKPSVAQQEKDWKFELEKVWGTAQTPFKGYALHFTPALKKTYTNFHEMERVCQTVGVKVTAKRSSKNDRIIVLASEEDDPDVEKINEDGESCYHKDLLTTSILRGKLDLDSDEFKIKVKQANPPRRKGPRKSS